MDTKLKIAKLHLEALQHYRGWLRLQPRHEVREQLEDVEIAIELQEDEIVDLEISAGL